MEKRIKFIPTDEMIKAVKEKFDREQVLMIDFALQTGARIGEILRFSADDVLDDKIVLYTHKSRNSNLVGRKIPYPVCLSGLTW